MAKCDGSHGKLCIDHLGLAGRGQYIDDDGCVSWKCWNAASASIYTSHSSEMLSSMFLGLLGMARLSR